MEVSVIIPFFNRAGLLIETIESIKRQSFIDFEVLIIDDGSQVSEVERVKEFLEKAQDERFVYKQRPDHIRKGGNSCRNFGFACAKGRLVKWFDSDDLMEPNLLEVQVAQLNTGFDGVLCDCEVWNEDFTVLVKTGWRELNFSANPLRDYLKTKLAWQTGCGLWRKDKVSDIEPFVEQITNAQEWIFHLKALTSSMCIGVSNDKMVLIRRHPANISSARQKQYFLNRLSARNMGLLRLINTRRPGKRYVLSSIRSMMTRQKLYKVPESYLILLKLVIQLPAAYLKATKDVPTLSLIHD